ncbi:phosphodiester glycosidase family protein [Sphingomonas sp. RT2P30]|uniref:phosphodiester glycosidase family protein n=1 Tax=Parasphingomonas halimpatiens TaxID=3096162 RepID=UPI002FCB7A42
MKRLMVAGGLLVALAGLTLWCWSGAYGVNVVARNGGSYWVDMTPDDPRLSPAMRLALTVPAPEAVPGRLVWHQEAPGFEVATLAVMVRGRKVDALLLNRIDPARYRFVVRNAPRGDRGIDEWERTLPSAALIVNGSYFDVTGRPDTPFLSEGVAMGPGQYDARAGAFVAGDGRADIRDLSKADWRQAFAGARNAMVSYPLLIGADGQTHVMVKSRWLANRSFVGRDGRGRIIIGSTREAFFPLDRLATFLQRAPLDLKLALNLDGGPVACQSVRLKGFRRKFYARWEAQVSGDKVTLLRWPFTGTSVAMPIVLTVEPR